METPDERPAFSPERARKAAECLNALADGSTIDAISDGSELWWTCDDPRFAATTLIYNFLNHDCDLRITPAAGEKD